MEEDETDTVEVQVANSGSRKKHSTGGKRAAAKNARYSRLPNSNVINPCGHNTKVFGCSKVTPIHVAEVRRKLCLVPEKLAQDGIISSLIQTHVVKRQDWELKDTKNLKKFYKDLKNISNMKRIFFKISEVHGKCLVRVKAMENFIYEGDESYQNLNKKSFTNAMLCRMEPQTLPLGRALSDQKKSDVDKLLQTIFGSWQNLDDNRLNWYKQVLFNSPTIAEKVAEEVADEANECDCLDHENCIRI
ncbi:unnamed protein product [Acanthoscelides obtectus]|uniref:Uncharacterized protein n=1 Tax=Acanthoscelides obtectus TaxID=200917 RepID=A0A9P0M8V8_ACAOB|nr:unnamed protein product [Acanthoscelides obtectus]CAK1677268.1 hypothetical protein AOBTE_LOCUS31216 [Acanthoscelides obtectus]